MELSALSQVREHLAATCLHPTVIAVAPWYLQHCSAGTLFGLLQLRRLGDPLEELEKRIRSLSAQLVASKDPDEVHALATELKAALKEHIQHIREQALDLQKEVQRSSGKQPKERRHNKR